MLRGAGVTGRRVGEVPAGGPASGPGTPVSEAQPPPAPVRSDTASRLLTSSARETQSREQDRLYPGLPMLSPLQEAGPGSGQVDSLPVCATMSHAGSGPRAVVCSDGSPQAAAGALGQRALQAAEWCLPAPAPPQHALPLFQVLLEVPSALSPARAPCWGRGLCWCLGVPRAEERVCREARTKRHLSPRRPAPSLGRGSVKPSVTAISELGISRGSSTAADWPG